MLNRGHNRGTKTEAMIRRCEITSGICRGVSPKHLTVALETLRRQQGYKTPDCGETAICGKNLFEGRGFPPKATNLTSWWARPVIPTTWKAEAGGLHIPALLELQRELKSTWAKSCFKMQGRLVTQLGGRGLPRFKSQY